MCMCVYVGTRDTGVLTGGYWTPSVSVVAPSGDLAADRTSDDTVLTKNAEVEAESLLAP